MVFKKVLTGAVALALVATAAIGCGNNKNTSAGAGDGQGGSSGQAVTINFNADPPILDSSKADTLAAFTFINEINEGLYRLDKDNKAVPALARDLPTISDDKLTYTITLRDNLKWADGSPLKAGDFVYAFQRILDPKTKAVYAFMVSRVKGGEAVMKAKTDAEVEAAKQNLGIVAKDDKTLEITLEKPVTFFPELLAFCSFFPMKEDFVKAQGDKYGAEPDKVLGAGPFKLGAWNHDASLELVKNENYWDAANVKLAKVTVNIVKETSTGLNLFKTGDADLTEITGAQIAEYKGKPELTPKKELTTNYLEFQETKVPALKNKKIRQALTLGINRQALVDIALANGSTASTGFVPTATLDGAGKEYRAQAGDLQPKFDAAKAKQLLKEGLQEAGLTKLPDLTVLADDTDTAKKSLEFIQGQWKDNLGIDVKIEPVKHELRVDRQTNKDYQIVLALWGADYNDPMTFLDMYQTGGSLNYADFSNRAYDDLINKAGDEKDAAARAKMLVDAEKMLLDEMPVGPLYFRTKMFVKNPNLEGVILAPFGQEWDLRWAYVK